MPTLHLSNFGSHKTPGAHGPGRKWSIMALQRSWEHGDGTVRLLVPDPDKVKARHEDTITHEQYVEDYRYLVAYRVRKKGIGLAPGLLMADTPTGPTPVRDGDTLLCACGVDKARRHRCHRVWAAAFLVVGGWEVVLDQQPLSFEDARELLRPGERGT